MLIESGLQKWRRSGAVVPGSVLINVLSLSTSSSVICALDTIVASKYVLFGELLQEILHFLDKRLDFAFTLVRERESLDKLGSLQTG